MHRSRMGASIECFHHLRHTAGRLWGDKRRALERTGRYVYDVLAFADDIVNVYPGKRYQV